MKSLISAAVTALLVSGTVLVDRAEARDRRTAKHGRVEQRVEHRVEPRVVVRHEARYFGTRDVYVIRDYYRPYHRPLPPGVRRAYYRNGHLPPGWAKRVRPIPVYVERRLPPVPYGYHRGIIDGHAVVYNGSGLIIDVAVLF